MEFSIDTNNVLLEQQNQVESGEYNVTECNFTFSSEFDGLTKKAVFTGEDGTAYLQTIVDNKCSIPSEILEVSQVVEIGVYAYDVENEELVLRYSPEPTQFYIHQGSYKEAQNSTPPTPSEIEQLQAQITTNANNIEELTGDVVDINTELATINNDIADIQAEQVTQNTNIQNNADDIAEINRSLETINSDIHDIQEDISDIKAEQTEQNTKIQKNTDDIGEINQDINVINEDIDNLEQELTNYSLITETGSQINLNVNSTNYQITAILNDKNGNVIYTSNAIDLPIESMIVNASYDNTTKEIVLTLQNGNTLRISIADLVSGLVSETQLQTILANYYTKTEVNNLLNAKANQTSLDATNQNVTNLAGRVLTNEEDIADIKEEQTTQNTNIEELQSQVETLQEDLESANAEIEELNTDITNMAKAMYKVDGQGSDITLENTSENKFVEFGLEGRTEQEQLSGKNLANINAIQNTEIITISNDTIILANNSNAVGYITTGKKLSEICPSLQVGDIVTLSFNTTSNSVNKNTIYFSDTDTQYLWEKGETIEITQKLLRNYIVIYGGYNETAIISEFMIRKSTENDTYEPYCGGIPSPNPDYPQQIKNVTGQANVKIQNKNLFDKDNATTVVGYFSTDGSINYGGSSTITTSYSEIKPNTNMIVSGCPIEAICFYDKNKNFIERSFISANVSFNKNAYFIRLQAPTNTFDINKLQLEEGSTATSYVPHEEQNYPFTFAEGQILGNNEELKDNGKDDIWGEYIFTGNENWINYQSTQSGDFYKFYATGVRLGRTNNMEARADAFCTHFINDYFYGERNGIGLSQNATYISINKTIASTPEELKTWFATQYANGKPVKVQYKKKNPTVTAYTETQQAQYDAKKEATSYDDITYITSTSDELGFDMKAIAVADANKVINSLDTRLLALEGNTNQSKSLNVEVDKKNITKETAENTAENAESSAESEEQ